MISSLFGSRGLLIALLLVVGGIGWWLLMPVETSVVRVDGRPDRPSALSDVNDDVDAPRNGPSREDPTKVSMDSSAEDISEFARAWDSLDLAMVRRVMPDNLVWLYAMPSKDPEVLRVRKQMREKWEKLYGKVYSNTGSVEEVNQYYGHQQQLSSDYVEFTSYIIDNYSGDLREQDLRLLNIARKLHMARLQEIPQRQADALGRREAFAKARDAWLAEDKEPATGEPDDEVEPVDGSD